MNDLTKESISIKRKVHHVFQPIMDLSQKKVYSYEALLRSEEFANPQLLFENAKDQHEQFELDLHSIFKAFSTYERHKIRFGGCRLSVNVYPSTLTDPAFRYALEQLLSVLEVSPESFMFEIIESEKISDLNFLTKVIEELKGQGFLIALDDIGKGESSLRGMIELEPDIAKFDRYFAQDLSTCRKKQKLIKLLLSFFGDDILMVLEGIERQEDLHVAKELGVPLGQGYLLGKPVPVTSRLLSEFVEP